MKDVGHVFFWRKCQDSELITKRSKENMGTIVAEPLEEFLLTACILNGLVHRIRLMQFYEGNSERESADRFYVVCKAGF